MDENVFFHEALRESEERHRVTLQIVEENRLASEVEIGSLSRMIRGKE